MKERRTEHTSVRIKPSAKDIMENRGINRIYDCGSYVYIWKGTIYN